MKVFVDKDRTVLVTVISPAHITVATRETPQHVWGPPVRVEEERANAR